MKQQALFIGINNYKHGIQPLSCAKRDADELRLLFARAGFETDIMTNEEASGSEAIRKRVRKLTSGLGPGDLFLFYFSGHGVYVSGRQLLLGADADYAECEQWLDSGGRGTPVGAVALDDIAYDTDKSFDSVFILDMCRTPLRDGQKGGAPGLAVRDLSLRNPGVGRKANFTYLFSCDTGQPALEIRDAERGLFSLAFSSVFEDRLLNQRRLLLDEAFVGTMESEMRHVAQKYDMNSCGQRPQRDPHGDTIVLFDPAVLSGIHGTPTLVVCPLCGRKNEPKDTFRCRECGRDNLCLRHQDEETFLCKQCVAMIKEKCENVERLYQNGEYHYHGRSDVHQDYSEAVKWYRKAAELGYAKAQFMLGKCYDEGHGVERSELEAAKWWRKAADQGHVEAQLRLGDCYGCHIPDCAEDQRVPRDDAESAKWYLMAAEQGHAEAQYALGCLYYCGQGVPKDNAESAKWYRKAAEHGHAEAQVILGGFYEYGDNVPQDNVEAAKWYGKAAAQGNARAQYFLGELYYNGQGVPQDYAEAAKWYRKAAEQEDAVELDPIFGAMCRLGELYDKGLGVPKNHVEASKWYGKAAVEGVSEALEWCRKAAKQGDKNLQDLLREHGWD